MATTQIVSPFLEWDGVKKDFAVRRAAILREEIAPSPPSFPRLPGEEDWTVQEVQFVFGGQGGTELPCSLILTSLRVALMTKERIVFLPYYLLSACVISHVTAYSATLRLTCHSFEVYTLEYALPIHSHHLILLRFESLSDAEKVRQLVFGVCPPSPVSLSWPASLPRSDMLSDCIYDPSRELSRYLSLTSSSSRPSSRFPWRLFSGNEKHDLSPYCPPHCLASTSFTDEELVLLSHKYRDNRIPSLSWMSLPSAAERVVLVRCERPLLQQSENADYHWNHRDYELLSSLYQDLHHELNAPLQALGLVPASLLVIDTGHAAPPMEAFLAPYCTFEFVGIDYAQVVSAVGELSELCHVHYSDMSVFFRKLSQGKWYA